MAIGGGASVAPPPAVVHVPIMEATVATLTVSGLKDELNKRGRGTGGNKPALITRLKAAIADGIPIQEGDVVRGAHLNGLDVTCHWRFLNKIPIPIAEPTN